MILSWNCQGIGGFLTVRLHEICRRLFPGIIFLMEIKGDRNYLQELHEEFGYDYLFTVDPQGLSGDLAFLALPEFKIKVFF